MGRWGVSKSGWILALPMQDSCVSLCLGEVRVGMVESVSYEYNMLSL